MTGRINRPDKLQRDIMPVVGKIKVGRKNDKGHPESLDYFVAEGNYAHLFHEEYGDKPRDIEIVFLSDSNLDSCYERFEIRQGKKMFAKGDGTTFEVWSAKDKAYKTLSVDEYPDLMKMCEQKSGGKWQSILTLRFIMPRPKIMKVLGVWQFSTRGELSSIPQIIGPYDKVKSLVGSVVGVRFNLTVEKVTSQSPGSQAAFPVVKLLPQINKIHLEHINNMLDQKQIEG